MVFEKEGAIRMMAPGDIRTFKQGNGNAAVLAEKKMRKHLAWQGATHQEVDEAIDRAKKEPPK